MLKFIAYSGANKANITGDGTAHKVVCDTVIFDEWNAYNPSTGICASRDSDSTYLFSGSILLDSLSPTNTGVWLDLVTTQYRYRLFEERGLNPLMTRLSIPFSAQVQLSMSDTVHFEVSVTGNPKTVGILGGSNPVKTYFCGSMIWP